MPAVAVVAATLPLVTAGAARGQVATVPTPGLTAVYNHLYGYSSVESFTLGSSNTLYVGGQFDRVAMRTGHWVRYDGSGVRDPAWPEVDGPVLAVVADGAGGWYLGGEFAHVARQPRAGLAHVGAGGELDPAWAPAVDAPDGPFESGGVKALCVVGDSVYVGGYFTAIDGQPRAGLAAVNAVDGRVRAWNPRPNDPRDPEAGRGGAVHALAAASGKLFAGGAFTRIGSEVRHGLAAFDTATGGLDAWNPGVAPARGEKVMSMVIDRGTLYVGGLFEASAGRRRSGLAAFDVATGALGAWNPPSVDGPVNALAVAGDTVYLGGDFFVMGGADRFSLAAVDARTGRLLPWRADVDGEDLPEVNALAVVGDRVYVGGEIDSIAGQPRSNLAAVSAATGALTPWDPEPSGQVFSLVAAGDGVLVGGDFSGVESLARNGLAAIDLGTGALLPFDPHPSSDAEIDTVVAQGDSVFVAGDLGRIGGRRRFLLAKLDAQTGRAQSWDAHVRSSTPCCGVDALAVHGSRLYVGGTFTRIGGRRRRRLAALDVRTGRATRWRVEPNGDVGQLAVDGHTLYIAGSFTRLAGRPRRGLAAVDLRSGRVTAWNPNPDGKVNALAVAGGRVYLGGEFRHVGGRPRTRLAAVNTAEGKPWPWRPRANRPVDALAVIANTVYAGGEFASISGTARRHIAALDSGGGTLTAWNPGADGQVSRLLATPAGLVAGGSFGSLGGTAQAGLGIFPLTDQPPASSSSHPPR